ncbi:hypothetical protein BDV25DRAFT_135307 [Aspergillus avenaceus]|uniref:tyrosinase n=1 Tax=Aspergillus avenaceus TaxID=36643 RepID=A0A5N6U8N1_ASPAV|nr:hypothetical protein BDV25DRAFT_135307 [Aspergillus avenaceus]
MPTRKNIRDLSTEELDKLIKAFKGIQDKHPEDPDSFFHIAGYHGQPFRGAGYENSDWWGGYCHHGNVLFPTWHRAYLWRLEKALQTVPGCGDVTIPFWNQVKDDEIPPIFLKRRYEFQNKDKIDNPLYSYKLQRGFYDKLARTVKAEQENGADQAPEEQLVDYGKFFHYETVRYPYSGLVGPQDIRTTELHNEVISQLGDETVNGLLNLRICQWLQGTNRTPGIRTQYNQCLRAPNYTVFSNTTSATKYNDDHSPHSSGLAECEEPLVCPIEKPHNGMHLAVGGYDMADNRDYSGANGDMGENDTASFDPIFFFHHCFIDLVFWSWQVSKGKTEKLEITPFYPGTNSVDSQGPTPGMLAGEWLSMKTPLHPFMKYEDNNTQLPFTSEDVVDISRLGYSYDKSDILQPHKEDERQTLITSTLRVSGIDRGLIAGSFVILVCEKASQDLKSEEQKPKVVGYEPVFSRWHVAGCANCRNSLSVTFHAPIAKVTSATTGEKLLDPIPDTSKVDYEVRLLTNDRKTGKKTIWAPDPQPPMDLVERKFEVPLPKTRLRSVVVR